MIGNILFSTPNCGLIIIYTFIHIMDKRTVVLGASDNPERYSYKAVITLTKEGYTAIPIGNKKGTINGIVILNDRPILTDINTVTLYLAPERQADYYDYILNLKPKRVIFNPGTENRAFEQLLIKNGIEAIEACTLVMLAVKNY